MEWTDWLSIADCLAFSLWLIVTASLAAIAIFCRYILEPSYKPETQAAKVGSLIGEINQGGWNEKPLQCINWYLQRKDWLSESVYAYPKKWIWFSIITLLLCSIAAWALTRNLYLWINLVLIFMQPVWVALAYRIIKNGKNVPVPLPISEKKFLIKRIWHYIRLFLKGFFQGSFGCLILILAVILIINTPLGEGVRFLARILHYKEAVKNVLINSDPEYDANSPLLPISLSLFLFSLIWQSLLLGFWLRRSRSFFYWLGIEFSYYLACMIIMFTVALFLFCKQISTDSILTQEIPLIFLVFGILFFVFLCASCLKFLSQGWIYTRVFPTKPYAAVALFISSNNIYTLCLLLGITNQHNLATKVIPSIYLFNIIGDFLSLSLTYKLLEWIQKKYSFFRVGLGTLVAIGGALLMSVLSLGCGAGYFFPLEGYWNPAGAILPLWNIHSPWFWVFHTTFIPIALFLLTLVCFSVTKGVFGFLNKILTFIQTSERMPAYSALRRIAIACILVFCIFYSVSMVILNMFLQNVYHFSKWTPVLFSSWQWLTGAGVAGLIGWIWGQINTEKPEPAALKET